MKTTAKGTSRYVDSIRSMGTRIIRPVLVIWFFVLAAGCGGGPTFTVNDAGDGGDASPGDGSCSTSFLGGYCTLRAALEEANALAGSNTITFNLPAGSIVIRPASPLPAIMDTVIIDGTTQPLFESKPIVRIEGTDMIPANISGLTVADGAIATIRGIQILRFSMHGIENHGTLTAEHLILGVNGGSGLDSFIASGALPVSVNDTAIIDNQGAGISGINSDITILRGAVERNQSGGVWMNGGFFFMTDTLVRQNATPANGGGIMLVNSHNASISGITLEENIAAGAGGGVYYWGLPGTTLTIEESVIAENQAMDGAGVDLENGSLSMAQSTVITNQAANQGGGMHIDTSAGVTLAEVEVENNAASGMGGGIYYFGHAGSTLTLTESTVIANRALQGGGIFLPGGVFHIIRSSVTDNLAKDGGGGVFVNYTMGDTGTLFLEDNSFVGTVGHGNNADSDADGIGSGDGIYSHGALFISESTIEGNAFTGIYNDTGSIRMQDSRVQSNQGIGIQSFVSGTLADIRINRSWIRNNTQSGINAINANLEIIESTIQENGGSGVFQNGGELRVDRTTIADNSSTATGGGIDGYNLTLAEIRESAVWGNSAMESGGGVFLWGLTAGSLTLENVTIHGNQAGIIGGGLEVAHGAVALNNVTLTQNTAPAAGGIHSNSTVHMTNTILAENPNGNCLGAFVSLGYNIEDGMSCPLAGPGDMPGTAITLGPMQDNGGPTYTRAIFFPGPAHDAGNDTTCAGTDQRGITRPQAMHCDIGAFELGARGKSAVTETPAITPTLTQEPKGFRFDPITFSEPQIYHGGKTCKVKQVEIRVKVTPWTGIQSVGLFYRLEDKVGGGAGDWSEGLAMTPLGEGWYSHTLAADSIPGIAEWKADAWLAVQIVANGKEYVPLAHSEIRREVTLSPCKDYR